MGEHYEPFMQPEGRDRCPNGGGDHHWHGPYDDLAGSEQCCQCGKHQASAPAREQAPRNTTGAGA